MNSICCSWQETHFRLTRDKQVENERLGKKYSMRTVTKESSDARNQLVTKIQIVYDSIYGELSNLKDRK